MGKLYNFLLGVVVGFGLYHAAANYHLVYAEDGLHLIAKTPARLSEAYVDVRDFDANDWLAHPQLVVAIEKAGQRQILEQAARNVVDQAIDKVLPPADSQPQP